MRRIFNRVSILLMLIAAFLLTTSDIFMGPVAASGIKGAGTEDRNWITESEDPPTSTERYSVTVHEDVTIPMRDGVELKGRLFVPEDIDEVNACVLYPNGYGHGNPGNSGDRIPQELAERGYASIHLSMRGSGPSEGEGNLYNKYGQDGYDIVEWMAEQEWCDGNVGTIGTSLRGINQWLIAKENPPNLKAISPVIACGDCYDYLWYPGGMLPGPGRIARGEPEYTSAIEHRNFDDWWRERSTLTEDLKSIAENDIAVLVSGGWNDYISSGNVFAFKDLSKYTPSSHLIMGPGAHGSVSNLLPYDFEDYQVLWFDHYMKGIDNGIDERDPVLIYVQGADEWRSEEAWPIADARSVKMYLSDETSNTISSKNDGSFSIMPQSTNNHVNYDFSPEEGPFLHTMLDSSAGRLSIDQKTYEEQTVTWTTDALLDPTEITGAMTLNVWAESDSEDFDFVVQVSDVAPDGTSTAVTAGYLNAPRAKSRSNPEPVTPGKIEQYEIEILPTSYVFKEGHHIRISVSGGTIEHEEQSAPQGPGVNPNESSVKIYQGNNYPSSLDIPIVGTAVSPMDPGTIDDIKSTVVAFEKDGAFKNHGVSRSLQAQLDTVKRFENKGEINKAIKHMKDFQQKLKKEYEKEFISEDAYQTLDISTDYLLKKWE